MATEPMKAFEARVFSLTGVALRDMPAEVLRDGDTLPGPIVARRPADYFCRAIFVCGVGYPTVTDDGGEIYTDFVGVVVVGGSE